MPAAGRGATLPRKYVACPCGTRNDRIGGRTKCVNCDRPLRKLPQQKHKAVLREGYAPFVEAATTIHGVTDESCCNYACAKPRTLERRNDRDHDHRTGEARGLLCPGDNGCNVLLAKWITAATARGIADAKLASGEPDAARWDGLAGYLMRVQLHYEALRVAVSA